MNSWPIAILCFSVSLSMMLMLLLRRFAPGWSHLKQLFVAAALPPFLPWFAIFVVEVTLIIRQHYAPQEGFMVGVFIMMFIPMLTFIGINMIGIGGMLAVMRLFGRRA